MIINQLVRPQVTPRQFPPITADLYQKDNPVLRLVDAPLTRAQHYSEKPLVGSAALTRLLVLHRESMDAESKSDWNGATYLWDRVRQEAKALYPRAEVWAEVGGDAMRTAFYTEILCDTHLAFHNGYIEFASTNARAKFHENRMEDILLLVGTSKDEIAAIRRAALDRQIVQGWSKQDWQAVFDGCEAVLASSMRDPYPELAARAAFSLVTSKLGKANDARELARDIPLIESALRAVTRVAARQPYNSLWYEYLALLNHLLAIRQFNADNMAQALATERKALTYQPELAVAEQSLVSMRTELAKLAQNLQAARAKMRPGMSLTWQGQLLANQVAQGNSLEERFRNSSEATRIAHDVKVARGATVWRRIGLPDPTEKREETWIALSDQLSNFAKQHTPIAIIPMLWSGIVSTNPLLSPITGEMLMTYVQTYMTSAPAPQEPIPLPQVGESAPPQRLSVRSNLTQIPRQYGEAPFPYWWYSAQSRLVKGILAAGAVAVIVGIGGFAYGNVVQANRVAQVAVARDARQTAYDQLIAAVNAGNDTAALNAAETFFANLPISGSDNRLSQVDQLYNRALVDWVLQTKPPQNEIDARVSRYHTLRGTT